VIYSADEFFDLGQSSYDVCIIGSGPSGICVGLELLYTGLKVCSIAGGGLEESHCYSQLKGVECPELEIRNDSRVRAFGGTSATWSGFLALLDPIDMRSRSSIHSGWPSEADISVVINERGHRYDLPKLALFDAERLHLDPWPKFRQLAEKIFYEQKPPLNFGRKFKYAFTRSHFDLVLGAVATTLNSQKRGAGRSVMSATLKSPTGSTGKVSAKIFVLAAGGIENVRLLWNSDGEAGTALGNEHDQLGRGFMNHPKGYVGEVRFNRPLALAHPIFNLKRGHFRGYVGLRLDESLQDETLNCYLRLEPLDGPRRKLKAAVKSALRLNFGKAISSGVSGLSDLWELVAAPMQFQKRLSQPSVKKARVRCFMEMEPSPTNRITLSEHLDPMGVAIPIVKYRASERSSKSVAALLNRFSSELEALGIGKFIPYASSLSDSLIWDAAHHLGGTSMGRDPRTSVVNPELKLHGAENVYVAGGSVFPTGGNANPTLMMIGLSLRLADTVRTALSLPKSIPETTRIADASHGVIIIGAGRRVAEDVVPAIEALGELAHIQSIYATRPSAIFGRTRVWEVRPLSDLREATIAAADTIYVAVPPDLVPGVLAELRPYDCSRVRLIVDTPAISSTTVVTDYDRFRSVQVAEDSISLPWLPAVHACVDETSGVREIQFLNSAYRYHAIALAKAIARENSGEKSGVRAAYRLRRHSHLKLASGSTVSMREPRDYKTGRLNICLEDGRVVSSHPGADISIECLRSDDCCTGFSVANHRTDLSDAETLLVGRFRDSDNVITKMLDLKRVGLYRLLKFILSGQLIYSLVDGAEDAEVASALTRFAFYHRGLRPISRSNRVALDTAHRFTRTQEQRSSK